jgi:chromosome segregation ATPase
MENPTAEGRYKEHSIVRVELSNFQNYDHVVFRPGPRLNLVVGPNGSGKSAIVNAIALVLGADPKVLGRGSKISGFVTNGQSQGAVEIELRNPSGPNLVIKRVINSDNKSQYSLNGKNATEMVVKKRLEKAKIQVANLCTFLPQDKVGNFSKFTPQELLAETQKTIDQEDLYEVHCKLIEMQESSLSRLREEESLTTAVGNMRKRCENLQRDVKRFKDREEAREAIDLLEKRKLWVEFLKYQEHLKIVALEKKEAKEKLEEAQGKDEPMQQALEGMNKELAQAKAFCKRAAKEEMEEVRK